MIDSKASTPADKAVRQHEESTQRRPWKTPVVVDRGDVRDVTLGPTPGTGESGNPGILQA